MKMERGGGEILVVWSLSLNLMNAMPFILVKWIQITYILGLIKLNFFFQYNKVLHF